MMSNFWMMIAIAVIIIILGVLCFFVYRKKQCGPDYYGIFIIGLIWFPVGLLMKNTGFGIIGLVFLIIGLINKEKWNQKKCEWKKMSSKEQKNKIVTIAVLVILLLIGMWYLLTQGMI